MISSTRFAGYDWNVLKKENGKALLVFCRSYFGNEYFYFRTNEFFRGDCSYFYERMREYLNVTFSNYIFSENDKKHIIVVENKYPNASWGKDDLGFSTKAFSMKAQKDRVFPLRYVDVNGLSSRDLMDIKRLEKRHRVVLLPQSIDKSQRIPTISYYEDWKTERGYQEVDGFSFDTLRKDLDDDESDYEIEVVPAIWVDSSII